MKILYEDNHIIVVEKPVNIAVQADESNDKDLLTMLKEDLKIRYNKPGNVYCGLVHRLDRPVGGVMVFAKTSKAASRLSESIRKDELGKTYLAVVCGKAKQQDSLFDYLVKNNKTNMVTTTDKAHGKPSSLDYQLIGYKDGLSLVKIQLHTGRSHQIRVQFSSRNLPLYGDQRYNRNAKVGQQIALWAYRLELPHPTTKEKLSFIDLPEKRYPFTLFESWLESEKNEL